MKMVVGEGLSEFDFMMGWDVKSIILKVQNEIY